MGLPIVHGIMHEIGGHIIVDSSPEKGSVFRLLFPVKDSEDENIIDADSVEYKIHDDVVDEESHSILIVDDEESVTLFMKEYLELNGYEVTTFTSSENAYIDFCDNVDKYDILITDQTMPKMTGVELAKKIHQLQPGLPIIVCTGHDLQDAKQSMVKAEGVRLFLQKPLNLQELKSAIVSLLHETA